MALDDILAGVAGGLEGGLASYSWQKDYQQRDRKIDADSEIKRLQQEVRIMLESMKEGGRNERYAQPSGNVVAQQAGATGRTELTTGTQRDIATDRNAVTTRGQDINESLGLLRNDTTVRGQDLNFELGGMRDATARRGQDVGAATTRRGQDFGFTLGTNAESGRATRAGDANVLRQEENEKDREVQREGIRRRGYSGLDFLTPKTPDATREMRDGTGRPTAEPIEVIEPPSTDVAPPRSPEATGDQMQRLETQGRSLAEQYRREADPARKAALLSQIRRVRDALAAAQRKGGG